MENSCRRTILACYIGYIVQAIVNNFVPLLLVMFERTYQIPLAKITLLITINFCIQLAVDLLSAWFLDRIGGQPFCCRISLLLPGLCCLPSFRMRCRTHLQGF